MGWSTATETNNDYFLIERSSDLKYFETIGKVNGAGNSYTKKEYSVTDEQPLKGLNYYRLKQTDKDGKFEYSEIKSVGFLRNLMGVSVSPVPSQKDILVSFTTINKSNYVLNIYNPEGKLMLVKFLTGENGINENTIDISELPKGIYQLSLLGENDFERTKFVKE